MSNHIDVEYEDAYVIEERYIPNLQENDINSDIGDNLSLDSLNLSEDEDLAEVSINYEKLKNQTEVTKKKMEMNEKKEKITSFKPKIVKREEVVDDYIRNFFTQYNLVKTLEQFNQEYNELSKKGKFNDNYLGPITDVRIKNAKLEEKLNKMMIELNKAKKNAEEAKSQWEYLRKERDFHKENYLKTVSEKELINKDIKALKKLHEDFQSKISDLKYKYEQLCKSKSLMRLDTKKLENEKNQINSEILKIHNELEKLDMKTKKEIEGVENKFKLPELNNKQGQKTPWPKDIRNNIYLLQNYSALNVSTTAVKVIKAHDKPAACLSVHIRKQIVATGGDDAVFKIYNMANHEELASGIGHSEYISGIDIHPKGLLLATCGGDNTIKLWDLYNLKCKATLFDHNSTVWSTKFHDTGDFLLSCSEDSTIRLFDINMLKCRSTYTGHTDSINKINFQPFTNYFASCSTDKSISLWDMRLGLTVQTFYGHLNAINDVVFNTRGDIIYSCDADGIVKSWDLRKIQEINTLCLFNSPVISATCLEIDKSNTNLYIGHDNGFIGIVNVQKNTIVNKFKAHDSAVNGLGINLTNSDLYSVGSDGALTVWQ